MREHKYQAWHETQRVMLHESYPGQVFQWLHEGQPIIIRQYTGLKDSKDVEIYESDLVSTGRFGSGQGVVVWEADFPGWAVKDYLLDYDSGLLNLDTIQEVTGNLYECPEKLSDE